MLEINQIYNGDCLELMKSIPEKSVDLIITDPPYELENHGGGQSKMASRKLVKERHIDFISHGFDYELVFGEFLRIAKIPNYIIFCSNKQVSKIMRWFEDKNLSTTLLIWHKTNPVPFANGKHLSDVEFAVYVRGANATFNNDVPLEYKSKVYCSPIVNNAKRYHPTEKPIELLSRYIDTFSKNDDIVLDPFAGSGTTCIAALRENRKYIGIELDPHYYEVAKKRIETELSQPKLF